MELVQIKKKNSAKSAKERICRDVDKGDHEEGNSPFDPPDAYTPGGDDQAVGYDLMHPLLQGLRDEHVECLTELGAFEESLEKFEASLAEESETAFSDVGFARFFGYMNREMVEHNRCEEKILFPLLAQRLVESGEHSQGPKAMTAVDVLEAEHLDFQQVMAVAFNFFELAKRLPDPAGRRFVRKTAIEQGKALATQLRLHIFRENTVYFSLAHKLISKVEFDAMFETRG
jgi:iron-sulfur cluster repair protein YtfE (RIC family)